MSQRAEEGATCGEVKLAVGSRHSGCELGSTVWAGGEASTQGKARKL